jgi:hypothetical protein
MQNKYAPCRNNYKAHQGARGSDRCPCLVKREPRALQVQQCSSHSIAFCSPPGDFCGRAPPLTSGYTKNNRGVEKSFAPRERRKPDI